MIKKYLKKILEISKRGDATEESYYSCLEELLKNYTESTNRTKIYITTLPKKTEAGNPDFRIWDGKQHIVGYIEAKAPTVDNLDQIERTGQLKRYLHTFPNVILTNFFEFRLYRNGSLIDKVLVARPFIIHKLKTIPPVEQESDFFNMIEKFFSFSLPKVYNAKTLAIELAKRTRFLKDEVIAEELKEEEGEAKGFILGFYEAFRKYLISGLSKEEFADLYSQTITYGLFVARTRSENGFNRKLAYDSIPHTIGILRDVFKFISLEDLPQQMEFIIDDISEILAVTDVKKILHQYFHEGKGKDPVVHFYETFLAEYDPQTRERRGVYYTPESVVSYIVRSLHSILKKHFHKEDGFASNTVTVLDPAAGTLTFLAEAAKLAVEEFVSKYGDGGIENFINEHILNNFYAFELMMAPYAVGHLKITFLLEELGYSLHEDDRFKLYLTNTLEMEELAQTELPGMASLSEESHLAGEVKKEQPILAILGNPPYSGLSTNVGDWITGLIEDYKYVDGKHFGEKKHWLQDDYVKFIRFAQWKINEMGEGIVGYITNHSYLNNPTFRGMRQSLMKDFDEIYVYNLHGSSLKKEKCPDGSKDENVFDIRQGVAISIFIKREKENEGCKVYYSEIWGLREKKYGLLSKYDITKHRWNKLSPKSPYYFFVPRKEKGSEIYEKFWKIPDIFPVNVTGIVTARDRFVIDFDIESLRRKIEIFRNLSIPDDFVRKAFKLKDTRGWKLSGKRRELKKDKKWNEYFTEIFYRPFDIRYIYFTPKMVDWPRPEIMPNMMQENLGLIMPKRVETEMPWKHILCTNKIVEHVAVSLKTIDYLFPLYIYSLGDKKDVFSQTKAKGERYANINSELINILYKSYSRKIKPEEIFHYIYAIFFSNLYRTKYIEFLKMDFPRIPFTDDNRFLCKMAEYGKRLIDLHLLKSKELDPPVAKFQGKGDNKVEKLTFNEKEKRVYFNQSQYFEEITKDIWEYQIGGYQVSNKWLKDRKNRVLSLGDVKHYCKIATALKKTIAIQKEIDKLYPKIEEKIIEFKTD